MDENTVFAALCHRCVRLETQFFRPAPDRLGFKGQRLLFHRHTYADLVRSALSGCELCSLLKYGIRDAYVRNRYMKSVSGDNVEEKLFEEDATNQSLFSRPGNLLEGLECPGQFKLELLADWYHTNFTNITKTGTRTGFATMVLTREWGDLSSPQASFILATQPSEDQYLHDSRLGDCPDHTKTPPPEDAPPPLGDAAFREGHFYGREMRREPDLELAKKWIVECKEWHGCEEGYGTNVAPSRLISIQVDEFGLSVVQIVETDDSQSYDYVCLSHRWSEEMTCKTTKKNYEERLKKLDILGLPKTFRDAVTIASKLGYLFLWIDSLCIVQDDAADWESECPKMASIYAGAQVTIASPGAKNSDAGLLHPRGSEFTGPTCNLRYRDYSGNVSGVVQVSCVALEEGQWSYCFPDRTSFLEDRGWILQERILSSRVLYFGVCQMYFECNSCRHFEIMHFPIHIPRDEVLVKGRLSQNRNKDELFILWYEILNDYALRKFTFPMDQLPAISGIANVIHQSTSSQYLAGLWRDDLPRGLIWKNHQKHFSRDTRLSHMSLPYRAPSWSWARSDCRDAVPSHESEQEVKSFLEIVSAEVTPASHDPFGLVIDGVLKVKGKTKTGVIVSLPKCSYMSDLALGDPYSADGKIVAPFLADQADFIEMADGKADQNDVEGVRVVTLLTSQLVFSSGGQKQRDKKQTFALGLQRHGSGTAYVRIGIIREEHFQEVSQVETWFEDANMTELEIW